MLPELELKISYKELKELDLDVVKIAHLNDPPLPLKISIEKVEYNLHPVFCGLVAGKQGGVEVTIKGYLMKNVHS